MRSVKRSVENGWKIDENFEYENFEYENFEFSGLGLVVQCGNN